MKAPNPESVNIMLNLSTVGYDLVNEYNLLTVADLVRRGFATLRDGDEGHTEIVGTEKTRLYLLRRKLIQLRTEEDQRIRSCLKPYERTLEGWKFYPNPPAWVKKELKKLSPAGGHEKG